MTNSIGNSGFRRLGRNPAGELADTDRACRPTPRPACRRPGPDRGNSRPSGRAVATAATSESPRPRSNSPTGPRSKSCVAWPARSRNKLLDVEGNVLADPNGHADQRQEDQRGPADRQPRVAQQQAHDDRQHQIQQRTGGHAAPPNRRPLAVVQLERRQTSWP